MRRWLSAAALALGLVLPAPAAHADTAAPGSTSGATTTDVGSCPTRSLQQPLRDYWDDGWYYLVANGSFTDGLASWRTAGTAYVAWSSSPDVMGAGGGALALLPGSRAVSTPFCTDSSHDRARLFFRGSGRYDSELVVRITSTSSLWYIPTSYTTTYHLSGSSTYWRLSPTMAVPDWTDASGLQKTSISLEAVGGTFQVDDVMVDPWRFTTS